MKHHITIRGEDEAGGCYNLSLLFNMDDRRLKVPLLVVSSVDGASEDLPGYCFQPGSVVALEQNGQALRIAFVAPNEEGTAISSRYTREMTFVMRSRAKSNLAEIVRAFNEYWAAIGSSVLGKISEEGGDGSGGGAGGEGASDGEDGVEGGGKGDGVKYPTTDWRGVNETSESIEVRVERWELSGDLRVHRGAWVEGEPTGRASASVGCQQAAETRCRFILLSHLCHSP